VNILVINAGSSSVKYQLFDMDTKQVTSKGLAERIGLPGGILNHQGRQEIKIQKDMKDHNEAIALVLAALTDTNHGVVKSLKEITAVGHRVLHGGEKFVASQLITDELLETVREYIPLGPLHNPANIMGIEACMKAMPGVPNVAVFDTAFGSQSLPPKAFMYGLPYEAYEKYRVRRYGFHGTSHRYVSAKATEWLGKVEGTKVITCHLERQQYVGHRGREMR
jgi:acetate kinase